MYVYIYIYIYIYIYVYIYQISIDELPVYTYINTVHESWMHNTIIYVCMYIYIYDIGEFDEFFQSDECDGWSWLIVMFILVVDLPLWKMMEWKSVGIILPNIWKLKHVPNHQPVIFPTKWLFGRHAPLVHPCWMLKNSGQENNWPQLWLFWFPRVNCSKYQKTVKDHQDPSK